MTREDQALKETLDELTGRESGYLVRTLVALLLLAYIFISIGYAVLRRLYLPLKFGVLFLQHGVLLLDRNNLRLKLNDASAELGVLGNGGTGLKTVSGAWVIDAQSFRDFLNRRRMKRANSVARAAIKRGAM